ncbi:hypothetical protein ACFXGA_11850 [Actinosynnema sp. NPDC059335]|uniref:hypothetical protein n=1 Tax=Actinosynnema sp. NPDC059335 TaxID=3346804 RepID=UPI00367287DB
MSTTAIRDTTTMLRRNLRHMQRFPMMSIGTIGMPVMMMLLFVHVFGGSLGPAAGAGASYVDYLVPGILVMTVGDTLRGLLVGTPIGDSGYWAVGWCLVLAAVGYARARVLFNRDPSR